MSSLPPCPKCNSVYAYESGSLLMCPECGNEWSANENTATEAAETDDVKVIKDSNGTVLQTGDSVIIIKNLPVKGAPKPIKAGTKVNNIKLSDGDHNIDCRIEGFGSMAIKSEFVRKA
ncbi:MAG: zinc ribbon domain-containing protein YjdM [Bacteroidota bacterium]|nr:zinc ribbon domain-containing protein YjdM [Bacteroidota bacterium]